MTIEDVLPEDGLRLRGDWPHSATVYVLGAGFTKAFFEDAPLLRNWQLGPAVGELKRLPAVRRILEAWDTTKRRNIEQLMSRVEDLMPYDTDADRVQFALLLGALKRDFLNQIEAARRGPKKLLSLYRFASHCVFDGVDCLSFNSDTFLDEALWWANPTMGDPYEPYWHPDGGYGFFCRPASSVISTEGVFMDVTSTLLLKMHGSFNWYPLIGTTRPFGPEALVHFEKWLPLGDEGRAASVGIGQRDDATRREIARALQAEPFFVPPVLGKSAALTHPVVSMIWSRAFEVLARAKEVVFVGYSFPRTDLASKQLFTEALAPLDRDMIIVIGNNNSSDNRRNELVAEYTEILGAIPLENFRFVGALSWARSRPQTRRPKGAEGYAELNSLKRYRDIKTWRRLTLREERRASQQTRTSS